MKHNFLVLIDFSEASYMALKYAITLAKETNKNIHLFHVADLEKITQSENALIVIKSLNVESAKIKSKLKSLVELLSEDDVEATFEFSFGNERDEIEEQIYKINPQIVLIGKRKKRLNFKGSITNYFLNNYEGNVLISGDEGLFNSKTKISLACSEQTLDKYNINVVYDFHNFVNPPLYIINILNVPEQTEKPNFMSFVERVDKGKDRLRFEYLVNKNIAEGVMECITKEGVELVCLGRSKDNNGMFSRVFGGRSGSTSKNIIEKLDVPVLILGENK